MKEMDIGQVARWSGLPASTLRYYEEKGLIRSIGRNGLKRVFDASVVQRLSLSPGPCCRVFPGGHRRHAGR